MKIILFILSFLIFTYQVDFYDLCFKETSFVIEIEENNSKLDNYTSFEFFPEIKSIDYYTRLENLSIYTLSFNPIHLDQEIDPPDTLS